MILYNCMVGTCNARIIITEALQVPPYNYKINVSGVQCNMC